MLERAPAELLHQRAELDGLDSIVAARHVDAYVLKVLMDIYLNGSEDSSVIILCNLRGSHNVLETLRYERCGVIDGGVQCPQCRYQWVRVSSTLEEYLAEDCKAPQHDANFRYIPWELDLLLLADCTVIRETCILLALCELISDACCRQRLQVATATCVGD